MSRTLTSALCVLAAASSVQAGLIAERGENHCNPTTITQTATVVETVVSTCTEYVTVTAGSGSGDDNDHSGGLLPTLALPTLALPTLALPTLALPTLALPTLALPTLALPTLALPTLSVPGGTWTTEVSKTTSCSTTTTSSSTTSCEPTASSGPVPPPQCGNQGFDWAYYNNSEPNHDATYSVFKPETFKTKTPIYVNTTNFVGGRYEGGSATVPGSIYNSTELLKLMYFALNHHTYLYAYETGAYQISIPFSDDAVYLWTGAKAYSGWTDANADAKAIYNADTNVAGKASFTLQVDKVGSYVPLRFVYGQAQYGGGFNFTVTTPSGKVIVNNNPNDSPYVVRHSCDYVSAPLYTEFGQEK